MSSPLPADPVAGSGPTVVGLRPILVTGGAGFVGSNLVDRLAGEGHHVLVLDALSRPGVERNLAWLRERHPQRVSFAQDDVSDPAAAAAAASEASVVFHLAAQVAVTTSLEDPRRDFAVNVEGTLNLLEALRRRRAAVPLIFASTNKVYGDLADVALADVAGAWLPADERLRAAGISEDRPLDFHTPYGCSKGAADQYVLDYSRSFGVPTAVLRMSCVYGPRQMGTEDQGWVAHFAIRALTGQTINIFGDGRQVRDVLDVGDAVDAYLAAWRRIGEVQGRAFNLGGGPDNAISLLQLVSHLEELTGRPVRTTFFEQRAGDQRYYVSDTARARADLGLTSLLGWREGVRRLVSWLKSDREAVTSARSPSPRKADVRP